MKRALVAAIAAAALISLAASPALAAPSRSGTAPSPAPTGWTALKAGAEPDSNPLKGFVPYQTTSAKFPHSMEWQYFPLNAVMKGPTDFDWTAVEAALNDIASRGHQSAIRFYLDYPSKQSGIPQYLLDLKNPPLITHPYTDFDNKNVSVSPDYSDTRLRAALDAFIAALGTKYDGDPRIGYLQAGLLGFWGEWHTWPHNGWEGNTEYDPAEDWFAPEEVQKEVLDDFIAAFPHTLLEVRNPDAVNTSLPIGYHDDSFAYETKTSTLGWHFMDNMASAGALDKWKTQSIGGELRPEIQQCIFSVTTPCSSIPEIEEEGADFDFAGSVAQTHASWLLNDFAFDPEKTGYTGDDYARALAGATSLGYSFRATQALVPSTTKATTANVGVTIANVGVAPFYSKWPISLAVLDGRGRIAKTVTTDWLVAGIASGATKQFTGSLDLSGLRPGNYRVVAQVTNPLKGGQPIRFANADQDTVAKGWLTLGATRVVPSSHGGGHGGPGGGNGGGHGGCAPRPPFRA